MTTRQEPPPPTPHRRNRLRAQGRQASTHAGLWLDKYLADGEDKTVRGDLVRAVAGIMEPPEYQAFYGRWTVGLAQQQGVLTAEAQVLGRMVVGLGAESVLETAVTLHRTYGVPYIPGSALKGLTAAFARQRMSEIGWAADQPAYKTVFGTTKAAGYITFFDALYVPGSGYNGHALHPDVLTVHHPKYYANASTMAPADWDNPNPVSFLSATGRYLVALAGPPAWVETTFKILHLALAAEGIGAKTSSGYGRLDLPLPATTI